MSLRLGVVALFASLATAAAGCGGGTKACNPGTVFLTVTFDAQTKMADAVEVDVTVQGGQPQTTTLDHKAGDATGSVEVFFKNGYPTSKRVDVTVVALKSQEPMATGSATITMLPAGCASAVVKLTGSGGGDGAAGTSGAGGTTGAAGDDGGAGTTGAAGDDGGAGTTGAAGTDGGAGTTGAAGTDGGAGTTGAAGAPGCTEAATRPCSASGLLGKCATGTETCTAGKWGECSIKPAAADLCDTKGDDSNCNGTANEGCPCLSGDSRMCSDAGAMGNCAKGTQACTNGKWGACSIVPTTVDSCATKGDDANCNGVPNEGCACLVGDAARSCSAAGAKGNCAAGTQACVDGQWGACSVKAAAADSCAVKGDDANCNGTPNDGCACLTTDAPRLCSVSGAKGNCAKGTQSCGAGGVWGTCSIQPAAADSCTVKGDDANCNGTPNDGCPCVSGDTQSCGPAAVGICKPGTQTCANGVWGACMGAVNKGARDCTSANDNDCDGKPDNTIDLVCTCASGTSQACGAHPGADGKGPCKAGTQACVISADKTTSAWGACSGSVGPAGADTCASGNDDNCNGTPNESCACINKVTTRSCGYCNDGKQTCTDGKNNTYDACVGATGQGFTALTLNTGWTNSEYSTAAPAAALDCDGIVQFKGAMETTGTDATLFTLPANLRPASWVYVPIDLCGAAKGRLNISPTGTVSVQSETTFDKAQCFTSLEGASFAVSTSGFTAMTLQNGWTNAAFSTRNAGAKVASGIVRLQGGISSGTTSALFTLPVGMRPPANLYITADGYGAKKTRLYITTAGDVSVQYPGAFTDAQNFTSLEGVWFPLTATGYTMLSLQNGWTTTVYTTRTPAVTTGNGIVRFQGAMSTGGTSLQPFVLPVGFRPSVEVYTPVDLCSGKIGRFHISTNGNVSIDIEGSVVTDATCFTSLEGVSFGL
jgi:hypothetical protein